MFSIPQTNDMQFEQLSFLLSKYYFLSGSVFIPGLGMISRQRTSSLHQPENMTYDPPSFLIQFDHQAERDPQRQLHYLVAKTGNAIQEMQDQLLVLGQSICRYLENERKLEWLGIGSFHMDEEGDISFQPKTISTHYFVPVAYQQLVQKNTTESTEEKIYEVKQEEPETESVVESEEYAEEDQINVGWQPWQKFALMIVILSALFLSIRFFMGNFDPLGPTLQKLHPKSAPATYSKP
jgi:hypothetical protein